MNCAVYNIALDIHKTGSQVALSMIRGENKRKIVKYKTYKNTALTLDKIDCERVVMM